MEKTKDTTQESNLLQKPKDINQEHKYITQLTGKLSDYQLTNMKTWPFVVFDNLEKVTIEYNFEKETIDEITKEKIIVLYAGFVTYDFVFKTEVKEEQKEKALQALTVWTKFMFWKDTEVNFKKEGKEWK